MPTHVFESDDGDKLERFYRMELRRNPPKKIKANGKWYHRQYGTGSMVSVEKNYHVVGFQFDDEEGKLAARQDQDGFPVLTSKKEIRDFQSLVTDKSKGKAKWTYEGFGIHNK